MTCIIFLHFPEKFQKSPSLTWISCLKKNQQTYFPMYWRSHSPKNVDPLVSQFVTFETLFHGDQIGRSSTQPKPSCRTDPQVDESMATELFHRWFPLFHLGKCHGKWMFFLKKCIHHSHLLNSEITCA